MINHTGKAANEVYKGKSTLAINQDFSELVSGLKLRIQGAYDIHSYFSERRSVQPALYNALGRASDGSLIMQETVQEKKASYSKSTRQYRKYHFEATLNYDRLFGTDHRTSALVYYYISDSKDTDDATSNLSAIPLRYQGYPAGLLTVTKTLTCSTSTSDIPAQKTFSPADNMVSSRPLH